MEEYILLRSLHTFFFQRCRESIVLVLIVHQIVYLFNLEPGGVKTNYAIPSLKCMANDHPAYADPTYPAK